MRSGRVTLSVSFALSVRQPSAFELHAPRQQDRETAARCSCCTLPLLVEMDSALVGGQLSSTLVGDNFDPV
jgi:hypothetical protein